MVIEQVVSIPPEELTKTHMARHPARTLYWEYAHEKDSLVGSQMQPLVKKSNDEQ